MQTIYRDPNRYLLTSLPEEIPFFYVIQHVPSGKYYAGSKYGKNKRRPIPSTFMLPEGYCTSSEDVLSLIRRDGHSSFTIRKIRFFYTSREARSYEHRFLLKVHVPGNSSFINKHNAGKNWGRSGPVSEAHKTSLSIALKGVPKSEQHRFAMRKPKSFEHKLKLRAVNLGKIQTDETKEKRRQTMSKLRWWNNGSTCVRRKDSPGHDYVLGRIAYRQSSSASWPQNGQ